MRRRAGSTTKVLLIVLGALILLVAVAGYLVVSLLGQDMTPVELRLRLEPGRTYAHTLEMHQKMKQDMGEMGVDMDLTVGSEMTWEVLDADEQGNVRVKVTQGPVSLKGRAKAGGEEKVFDSADPAASGTAGMGAFAALEGKSYVMKVSPLGRVLEVEGLSEIMDALVAKLGGSGMEGAMVKSMLEQQLSKEAIEKSLNMSLGMYPDQPVSIGDSWTRTASGLAGLPAQVNETYTLKGRKEGTATIAYKGELDMAGAAQGMDLDLSGDMKGTITMIEATGCIAGSRISQSVDGKITAMGNEVEVEIAVTVTSSLVEKAY